MPHRAEEEHSDGAQRSGQSTKQRTCKASDPRNRERTQASKGRANAGAAIISREQQSSPCMRTEFGDHTPVLDGVHDRHERVPGVDSDRIGVGRAGLLERPSLRTRHGDENGMTTDLAVDGPTTSSCHRGIVYTAMYADAAMMPYHLLETTRADE